MWMLINKRRETRRKRRRVITLSAVVLVIGLMVIAFNYQSQSADQAEAGISVQKTSMPIPVPSGKPVICLDPGHGGEDGGATSLDGSITEAQINLTVAKDLQTILKSQGYGVAMARTDDTNSAKGDRTTICNAANATLMLAIHHNSFTDSVSDYATVLYNKEGDQAFGNAILGAVATKLGVSNQGISQFNDSELSNAKMPAVLSEAFFITAQSEDDLIAQRNSTRLNDEAQGLANGINNYFANPQAVPTTAENSLVITRPDD